MQGAFGTRRSGTLYLLASLMLGLLLAALVRAAAGAGWSAALVFALPLAPVYAFATGFSTYFLCRARPLASNSAWPVLAVVGFAALCTAGLWSAAALAWSAIWRALAPGQDGVDLGSSLAAMLFGLGVILYCLTAVAHYLAIELDRARQLETRELQTKLMAQDAELRMLRTQVDPHFLFNSLNSISALTSIDPAAARDMTLQLSEFFRHSLGLEAHRKVTLEAELKLVRHFLAIEQVRFGPRLVFGQDIADDALACLLPPMILQPLVENAVKHGIGGLLEGGRVDVVAARAGSILRISVANDVDHDQPPATGSGIGLANVRQRLAAAYAHDASVNWEKSAGTFRVDLALPAETMEA